MKSETHREHWQKILGKRPSVYCASWHITFDGRCLNCGWEPDKKNIELKDQINGFEVDRKDHLYRVKD